MKKVYILSGKNEQELADNINKFDKEIFATQPVQKHDKTWIAFVYVAEKEDLNKPTEKQVYTLKKYNYEGDISKLTKNEATALIKEYMNGN